MHASLPNGRGLATLFAALFSATSALGLAHNANATSEDAQAHTDAQEIVERAGISEAFDGLLDAITAGTDRAAEQVNEASRDALVAATRRERYLQPALDDVVNNLSALPPAQRAAALSWYRSPLGARITGIELGGGQNDDELDRQTEEFTSIPPTEARAALITQLLEATKARDLTRMLLRATITSGVLGALSSQPKELRPPLAQLSARLETLIEQSLAIMDQITFTDTTAVYTAISDAELAHYVEFLGTPAGTAINEIVMESMATATAAYAYSFGKALAESTEDLQAL